MDRDFYFHSNQVTIVSSSAALVYPALFPTFHQREMLDQAVAEKNLTPSQRANGVMLNSVEIWAPVGLLHT